MRSRPLRVHATRSSGEVLPLMFALVVLLLFACSLNERAGDATWRSTQSMVSAGHGGPARLDHQDAAPHSAISETRHTTSVADSRARLDAGGTDHHAHPRAEIRASASSLRPARGRAEKLPTSRLIACGYLAAPPTAPPASAPLT